MDGSNLMVEKCPEQRQKNLIFIFIWPANHENHKFHPIELFFLNF